MRHIWIRLAAIAVFFLLLLAYAFPWHVVEVDVPEFLASPYKLGLDLQGGVELDYRVDFSELARSGADYDEGDVVEGLKSIIERRVNALGTAEPTIQSASYAGEQHIIVQIPVARADGADLSEEERRAQNAAFIEQAKETIGRVVQLEFREWNDNPSEEDRTERRELADRAHAEIADDGMAFAIVGNKYQDQYENVEYFTGTGTLDQLPQSVAFSGAESVQSGYLGEPRLATRQTVLSLDSQGNLVQGGNDEGYVIVSFSQIDDRPVENTEDENDAGTVETSDESHIWADETPAEPWVSDADTANAVERVYTYEALFISAAASEWKPARDSQGRILNDRYLINTSVSYSPTFQPQVDLFFNDEGAEIFRELTQRLTGEQIAIFVGGELVTAPTVNETIPDGRAVITGQYTPESAAKLANDIKTGIVPAPIYLSSERTVDAKIGEDSLSVVMIAGIVGLVVILVFLIVVYRVSGLFAGFALVIYTLLLLAVAKWFGVVLTLASIAGLILSIGLAIDANILIFERIKEELRRWTARPKAVGMGFERSWATIWDSHLTSLASALILFIFGVSLIKGFGLMLGIGIVASLLVAFFISRMFVVALARSWMGERRFIGISSSRIR